MSDRLVGEPSSERVASVQLTAQLPGVVTLLAANAALLLAVRAVLEDDAKYPHEEWAYPLIGSGKLAALRAALAAVEGDK